MWNCAAPLAHARGNWEAPFCALCSSSTAFHMPSAQRYDLLIDTGSRANLGKSGTFKVEFAFQHWITRKVHNGAIPCTRAVAPPPSRSDWPNPFSPKKRLPSTTTPVSIGVDAIRVTEDAPVTDGAWEDRWRFMIIGPEDHRCAVSRRGADGLPVAGH